QGYSGVPARTGRKGQYFLFGFAAMCVFTSRQGPGERKASDLFLRRLSRIKGGRVAMRPGRLFLSLPGFLTVLVFILPQGCSTTEPPDGPPVDKLVASAGLYPDPPAP